MVWYAHAERVRERELNEQKKYIYQVVRTPEQYRSSNGIKDRTTISKLKRNVGQNKFIDSQVLFTSCTIAAITATYLLPYTFKRFAAIGAVIAGVVQCSCIRYLISFSFFFFQIFNVFVCFVSYHIVLTQILYVFSFLLFIILYHSLVVQCVFISFV